MTKYYILTTHKLCLLIFSAYFLYIYVQTTDTQQTYNSFLKKNFYFVIVLDLKKAAKMHVFHNLNFSVIVLHLFMSVCYHLIYYTDYITIF